MRYGGFWGGGGGTIYIYIDLHVIYLLYVYISVNIALAISLSVYLNQYLRSLSPKHPNSILEVYKTSTKLIIWRDSNQGSLNGTHIGGMKLDANLWVNFWWICPALQHAWTLGWCHILTPVPTWSNFCAELVPAFLWISSFLEQNRTEGSNLPPCRQGERFMPRKWLRRVASGT